MEDYKNVKQEIIKNQYATGKNIPLVIQVLAIYLLFNSLNLTAKLYMQVIYYERFQTTDNSIANIQYFCYAIVSVAGLMWLPKLVSRFQFRILLLISSLGPQIFLIPSYYATTDNSLESVIYVLAVICGFIGGVLQVLLLFTMLYYLSNLSFGDEKILYYVSFYFMHNVQWLFASIFQKSISELEPQATTQELSVQFIVAQALISLLFLTVFEPYHPRFGRTKDQVMTLVEQKIATEKPELKVNNLRNMILQGTQIGEEALEQSKTKSDEEFKNIMNNMTIQCFSLDSSSLTMIIEKDKFGKYKASYFENILQTIVELKKHNIQYLMSTILTVAMIETFLLIQFVDIGESIINAQDGKQESISESYFYVGLGYVLGCFSIGIFGDFRDKFIWLLFQLTLLQFGFIFTWAAQILQKYSIFFQISSAVLGFCSAGLTSTVISFLSYEFTEMIYMTDTLYLFYSTSFAFSALLYIITSYSANYFGFIVIQVLGVVNYVCLFRYYVLRKKR